MSDSPASIRVEKKGAFGDDDFFKDSVELWDQAMRDVVKRWETGSKRTKAATTSVETHRTYREIRSSNLATDDSQAVSITEEDDAFHILIDVKDYKAEDISVKVIDDQIVVEGSLEKKQGSKKSSQQFVRRFEMPPNAEFTKVSSALSRDGVLKVICPKHAPSGKRSSISVSASTRKEPSPERRISCEEGHYDTQQRRGTLVTHQEEWNSESDESADEEAMEDGRHATKPTMMEPPQIMMGPPPPGCITRRGTVPKV